MEYAAGKLAYVPNTIADRALASSDTVNKDKIVPKISTVHFNGLHYLTISQLHALHIHRAHTFYMSHQPLSNFLSRQKQYI